jgi:hypothetical protein
MEGRGSIGPSHAVLSCRSHAVKGASRCSRARPLALLPGEFAERRRIRLDREKPASNRPRTTPEWSSLRRLPGSRCSERTDPRREHVGAAPRRSPRRRATDAEPRKRSPPSRALALQSVHQTGRFQGGNALLSESAHQRAGEQLAGSIKPASGGLARRAPSAPWTEPGTSRVGGSRASEEPRACHWRTWPEPCMRMQ